MNYLKLVGLGDRMYHTSNQLSGGQQQRLCIARTLAVSPDIILMDEVLSVGDIGFQKKCHDTFMSFKEREKTIVLVTHDLKIVLDNCTRAMFLNEGKIVAIGKPQEIIDKYTEFFAKNSTETK